MQGRTTHPWAVLMHYLVAAAKCVLSFGNTCPGKMSPSFKDLMKNPRLWICTQLLFSVCRFLTAFCFQSERVFFRTFVNSWYYVSEEVNCKTKVLPRFQIWKRILRLRIWEEAWATWLLVRSLLRRLWNKYMQSQLGKDGEKKFPMWNFPSSCAQLVFAQYSVYLIFNSI